jgi:hypothetical protein
MQKHSLARLLGPEASLIHIRHSGMPSADKAGDKTNNEKEDQAKMDATNCKKKA